MVRPRLNHPTPVELEVLKIIWAKGPCTVRAVLTELNRKRTRAYTTVMGLMNVMAEKGWLKQDPKERAYIYSANVSQDQMQSHLVRDLLNRAFDGSAQALVVQLLEQTKLDQKELDGLQKVLAEYKRKR